MAEEKNYSHMLAKVETIITFLDCDQAKWYLQKLEYKLKFEDIFVDDITLREFYLLYTRTAILRAELSKALEMVDSAMRLPSVRKDLFYRSECSFLKGTCLMYQGKLQQAEIYAQYAREEAQKVGMRNRYSRRNSCLLWRVCPAGTIFFLYTGYPDS